MMVEAWQPAAPPDGIAVDLDAATGVAVIYCENRDCDRNVEVDTLPLVIGSDWTVRVNFEALQVMIDEESRSRWGFMNGWQFQPYNEPGSRCRCPEHKTGG